MTEEYFRPESVQEALKLKSKHREAQFMGGGVEINSKKLKVLKIISLDKVGLNKIKLLSTGLVIGATATIGQLLKDKKVYKLIKSAVQNMDNINIRNMATLGGHLATNNSLSDLIPLFLALNCKMGIDKNKKEIPLCEYIKGKKRPLIREIIVPKFTKNLKVKTLNLARSASDLPLISVAVSFKLLLSNKISKPIVAVGGIAPRVIRLEKVEQKLDGEIFDKEMVFNLVHKNIKVCTDFRGSDHFKRYITATLVSKAFAWEIEGENIS